MKVLYDNNLPLSLVALLSDVFPEADHVRSLGMATADDLLVWNFAKQNGYVILSKDSDFQTLAFLKGHPPKSIRLKIGNASVAEITDFLRTRSEVISQFMENERDAHLELS